ncbi:MAG: GIY-YIG nuclease family protein [Nanoarchaeota archaeon]|nr:GIY-YIG nuclease family protein [Nanoarchaeota archaeon]
MQEKNWCVYLLECLDNSYYTGITNDLMKRMDAHKSGKGSKYVLAKGFGKLLSSKNYLNKSEALKAEYKIKQLPKDKKLIFFSS